MLLLYDNKMHFIHNYMNCFILFSFVVLVQGSFSEAHPVIAHVELCVVRSNEDISQNPDGAHRRRNVQPHETGEADGLSEL